MSLVVNNNIAALNAYRNLTVSDGQMSKSLEKLSSGFRINRAADDAAGLVISENLRSQTGGLKVAVRNAQDGISVVQTAEGALNEVHSILQRMRDLAVQASNSGSADSTAVSAAQSEFTQLSSEIDRIGAATQFGNTKLLDGTYGTGANKLSGYFTLDTDADAVTAGNQAGVSVGAGVNGMFNLTANDAGGAAVNLVDVTVAPGATGGYTKAANFQAALQTAIDTKANGTNLQGHIKVNVTDTGDGHWKTEFTNDLGTAMTVSDMTTGADATHVSIVGKFGLTSGATVAANTTTGGVFQVGANNSASDHIAIGISQVSSASLSLNTVDLTTTSGAQAAIDTITSAISTVSSTRGNLGAYQNRLEHTIKNLSVTQENLTASESRIRDTDMASEMTQFTRAQILNQAGTAMLAQANQSTQGVLQLLRG